MDGYCYLEILSLFDLTMHSLPFVVAINNSKEKLIFISFREIILGILL